MLQLSQASKDGFSTVASQFKLKLSLENKDLIEKDFSSRFGKNGIFKEVQYLDLSSSSFHPARLRYLPKTLKIFKLRSINARGLSEYGFKNEAEFRTALVKALV